MPPVDPISFKPPCFREDALAVVARLRGAGHVAYFAGGSVRDLLLGIEPKDYDVATDAAPEAVRRLFPRTQAVGMAFGVILVRQNASVVEVATFRADAAYLDGRRPTAVRFTDAKEDASRRDFTINGIFFDPLDEKYIDYVGGQADLAARVIRAIGDPHARFEEDHLRLLRAVRFAARLNFTIEPVTAAAIARHAKQLARISPERVAEELRLMLTPVTRVAAWRMLREFGLDQIVFRFLFSADEPMPGATDAGGIFDHLRPGQPIPFGLALAGASCELLCERLLPPPSRRDIFDRPLARRLVHALRQSLKISNDESHDLEETLLGLGPLLADQTLSLATMKRFLALDTAGLSMDLLAALAGRAVDPDRAGWLNDRMAELRKTDYAPRPLLTGDDLTAAGYQPGPAFKHILDSVYDAQLEDRIRTPEEAMALAAQLAAASGCKRRS